MKKLDIIVIGLGHQSLEDHLPAIKESDYWNLIGVSDIDQLTSQKTAEECNVPFASNAAELLEILPKLPDVSHKSICQNLHILSWGDYVNSRRCAPEEFWLLLRTKVTLKWLF